MTAKAETTFIQALHKVLPEHVYREKMNNPYRGGTPDCYYEHRRNLWVEYKFVILPKRDDTFIACFTSELQRDWLRRCFDNGLNPFVITGCKVPGRKQSMGVVYSTPSEWETGLPCGEFKDCLVSLDSLADIITRNVS